MRAAPSPAGDLGPLIGHLAHGATLTEAQARSAFDAIMDGTVGEAQLAAFVMGLAVRGETVDEITAGAKALRARATPVHAPAGVIDTCGTGGDAKGTVNISTTVAFVLAGAGVPVAKHGNRAASSRSGSSDVLAALGVNLEVSPEDVARAIETAGIGFLMAPRHHAAMRHVAGVRQALRIRTIFNLLGPLSNPAGAKHQLLGVFDARWLTPMAEVLRNLGAERVWVVHGLDGLDELSIAGPSRVAALERGAIETFDIRPEDAGLRPAPLEALAGAGPEENAAALRAVLDGERGAYRDVVLLNAAAGLMVTDRAGDLREGVALAAQSIDEGHAATALSTLIAETTARSPQ